MLERYLKAFARLNRATARKGVFGERTRNRAPHKPFLLLALLDLFEQGTIPGNFIELTPALTELFDLYWSKVLPPDRRSSIAFPFFRLKSEGFWHLVPNPGKEQILSARDNLTTVGQLQDLVAGVRLDEGLYALCLLPEARIALRGELVHAHFSAEVQAELLEQGLINRAAFDYSRMLLEKGHGLVAEGEGGADAERAPVRDQGFRRAIVTAYDHRCALCGIRMLTPDGHTVVDAAHIVPWSKSRNDKVTNGMALCRLCHWAFDKGMMGVRDDYTVIASPRLGLNSNAPGFLLTLSGRGMIGPEDQALWPGLDNLRWHRSEHRLSR